MPRIPLKAAHLKISPLLQKLFLPPALLLLIFSFSGCATPADPWLSGKSAFDGGQYEEAIASWTQPDVAENNRYSSNYYRWLGHAYRFKKQNKEAVDAYKQSLRLRPERKELEDEIRNSLRAIYSEIRSENEKAGQLQAAINTQNELISIDPDFSDNYAILGYLYNLNGRYDESITALRQAIELNPDNDTAYNNIGWAYFSKANNDAAIKNFSVALQLKPDAIYPRRGRAWSYYYSGKFEDALKDFDKLSGTAAPEDRGMLLDAARGKAYSYLGMGDGEKAVSLINKAKEISDYNNSYELALIYYVIGDREKTWQLRGGRGMVGIYSRNYNKDNISGVEVASLHPGGPAEKAGIIKGDVIIKINETPVTGDADFTKTAIALIPGENASFKLIREGVEKELTVQVSSAEPLIEAEAILKPIFTKKKLTAP